MSNEESAEEFAVTLRPTRTGFKHPHDEGKILRLWEGETNRGQKVVLLSYGFYCEGVFEGMDYTPIDSAALSDVPANIQDRLAAINALTGNPAKTEPDSA